MNITTVTITGADDKVNPQDLADIQKKYKYVEWGILVSPKNHPDKPRYPSFRWIEEFRKQKLDCALHICGEYARDIMERHDTSVLMDAHKSVFNRFQINYTFKLGHNFSMAPIIDWAENNPYKSIILQYNQTNKLYLDSWLCAKYLPVNIQMLYDSSGGNGKSFIDHEIDGMMPFHGCRTGYAGGIKEDNMKEVCETLSEVSFKDRIWIDLETGARDDEGNFSLPIVNNLLTISKPYIRS